MSPRRTAPRTSPLERLREHTATLFARSMGAPARLGPPAVQQRYRIGGQSGRVTRLAWSPDGTRVAVPSRDGLLRVHAAHDGAPLRTLAGHARGVMGVTWAPNGNRVASVGDDDRVLVWEASSGECLQAFECPERSLIALAWCPHGPLLVATSENGHLLRWRDELAFAPAGYALSPDASLPSPGALSVAWSSDGERVVVGARDGSVRVWDPWRGRLVAELCGHSDAAVTAAWAPNDRLFATGSKDGTIRLWHTDPPRPTATLDVHTDQVTAVAFSPDGSLLASKSRDGTVLLWRPDPWRVVEVIGESSAEIGWSVGLAFHPREPWLATLGDRDRAMRVWNVDRARLPSRGLSRAEVTRVARPPARILGEEPRRHVMLR